MTRGRDARRRRVALICQNVVQATNDPFNATLLLYAQRSGRWDFVLVAEATERAVAFLRHIDCDGALARLLTPAMAREARRAVGLSAVRARPGTAGRTQKISTATQKVPYAPAGRRLESIKTPAGRAPWLTGWEDST